MPQVSSDVELKIPFGPWLPEEGEHASPGVMAAVRGWTPWPAGGWRPYPYFVKPEVNLGGQVHGGHYHVWDTVWEAYVARDNSGDVGITRVTLQAGAPPTTLAIGSALDVTGTPWATTALVAQGYSFISFGKYVLLAGDESKQIQVRDSTGASAFADAIPAGSTDRPSGRYMASAGLRVVIAYITHNSTTSRDNYESDDLTDENLVIFSGLKGGYAYWSTPNTAAGGTNNWDPEELANSYKLVDELGVITGLATTDHGFGWVWKEQGLYRMDFQQSPVDFRLVSDQHGTRSPQSIVVVEDEAYWYDQLGHFCRVGPNDQVEDFSSRTAMSVLLDDGAHFLGHYSEDDLTQGDNDTGSFEWGDTEKYRVSVDVETILGGTGVHRYPCGFWDAHSRTVRWIYPGTYRQMEGMATVASGQTTLTRTSGTLFNGTFMPDRTIDLDGGTHSTTVASVSDAENLELAVANPGADITNKVWFITFQRYLEMVFQPVTGQMAVTDLTHAHDNPPGELPWQMHWGISAPNFGVRLARNDSYPQHLSYAPRDVLYAFIYDTTVGVDSYSLTYGWPYADVGLQLLDESTFLTSFDVAIMGEDGVSVRKSEVVGIRIVYAPRQRALENAVDLEFRIVVYTKVRAGAQRDSSNTLRGPLVSAEQWLNYGSTTLPPTDNRGFWPLTSNAGNWHQIQIRIEPGPTDADNPVNATEVISSIDHIEVRLRERGL